MKIEKNICQVKKNTRVFYMDKQNRTEDKKMKLTTFFKKIN